jgi:hypothetical protein
MGAIPDPHLAFAIAADEVVLAFVNGRAPRDAYSDAALYVTARC